MFTKNSPRFIVKAFVRYCHKNNSKSQYAATLILPKTTFPLRLNGLKRAENDRKVYEKCEFEQLYRWQRGNLPGPEFVLHDGPPYANGDPHVGHVINKILKDIIIRERVLNGQKVHYVPGWDCHGLPIELKALSTTENVSPIKIRAKARKYAENTVKKQLDAFKSWGILADWNTEIYCTFTKDYVINQMHQFLSLYEKGFIYRDLKPVFWSPSSRTALAESELEYNIHKSKAITLKMKIISLPEKVQSMLKNQSDTVHALIWTTTPWTLPANQGICYNPNLSYSLVKVEGSLSDFFIVATDLIAELNIGRQLIEIGRFDGVELKSAKYLHPFNETVCEFYEGVHVSAAKGTGLVHTAPAHGPEDFLIALTNKIPIVSLVGDDGCFTKLAGTVLEGLPVLTTGAAKVIELLQKDILDVKDFEHSYPYDWRTKKPVIIKASQQWFIDTNKVKNNALKELNKISIYPEKMSANNRQVMTNLLSSRPYWCISRQRVWGTPIPVLYHKETKTVFVNQKMIANYCKLIEKHGTDFWWTLSINQLVTEEILRDENLTIDDLEKSEDILDIWFDSGISWSQVLHGEKIADLYLEGLDQTTGWFQSSLLTSVAIRGCAPYRNLFIHGFAVDEHNRKMSKSLGNVIDPSTIITGKDCLGVDTLRWWVACHGIVDSKIPVSHNLLKLSAENVQKVRAVLRFCLGNLQDFDGSEKDLDFQIIDGYLLHVLHKFYSDVFAMYKSYQFNRITTFITNFVTNEVSALYFNSIKNRLYCENVSSASRKASQFVLYQILQVLNRSIAPIVPHLAEEVQLHVPMQLQPKSVFKTSFKLDQRWEQLQVENLIDVIMEIKRKFNQMEIDVNTWTQELTIHCDQDYFKILSLFQKERESIDSELTELLQVSKITINLASHLIDSEFELTSKHTTMSLCERCRRHTAPTKGSLCPICTRQITPPQSINRLQNVQ